MRTVITGGAGFIGSHLCERLVSEGHEVVCVDSLITGSRENLAGIEESPLFTFVQSDVSETLAVDGQFDRLLHMASPASPIHYLKYPIDTLRAGSLGTFHCLEAARLCSATFLLTSTSEVYGNPEVSPQPESYWGNVNPIGVRSVYDESKRFAEAATMAYRREHHVDTKIVRIFNTYGPRMRSYDGRVVPAFINQALAGEDLTVFGDGSQTRSFCFVTDMVEGLCRMLEGNDEGPLNLGNPAEITVLQLAQEIIALTGSRSGITHKPLPDDDPELRRPDLTRAKKSLGWEPVVGREEGLKRTVNYFRDKS